MREDRRERRETEVTKHPPSSGLCVIDFGYAKCGMIENEEQIE